MKKGLWHKRIPTVAALGLLLVGLWVTTLLIQTGVVFVGQAGPNKVPQNITVSNITDKSFAVSFTTNEKTVSAISVTEGSSPSFLVYDDRNKRADTRDEYFSHFITIGDLKPNTSYTFSILADGETYIDGNKEYNVKTGPPIVGTPPTQNPLTGKVLLIDGTPGEDVVVELETPGAQIISVLTNEEGDYLLPTNSLRTKALNSYVEIAQNQEITIKTKRQGGLSTIKTLFSGTGRIPTITLEAQYDFTSTTERLVSTSSSQLRIPTPRIGVGEVRITIPDEDQTFVDTRPLFRGTALARQTVKITYGTTKTEATSDGNGIWTFRPDEDIPPGQHTLTIQSVDRYGIAKSVSQEFTVFSSGSQVAQTATPSATPTITIAPTNTPTPTLTPTLTPTRAPSITTSPTPTGTIVGPTSTPTATLTMAPTVIPTSTLTPSPTAAVVVSPPPPGSASAVILTTVSVLLIFAGGALLFLL